MADIRVKFSIPAKSECDTVYRMSRLKNTCFTITFCSTTCLCKTCLCKISFKSYILINFYNFAIELLPICSYGLGATSAARLVGTPCITTTYLIYHQERSVKHYSPRIGGHYFASLLHIHLFCNLLFNHGNLKMRRSTVLLKTQQILLKIKIRF